MRKSLRLFPRLKERLSQRAQTLSGGERQMLSIGVGLMGMPELLILDEPSVGLAPIIKEELARAIGEIAASGVTMIVVDQDVELLLGICERLYLIEKGSVSLETADVSQVNQAEILEMYFGKVTRMTLEAIVAIIASGLVSGSLYALMASGLSLVWGTVRMFNFAHGAMVMIGAYSGWYISNRGGLAKVLQPLGKNITNNSEDWGLMGDILLPLGEWILSIKRRLRPGPWRARGDHLLRHRRLRPLCAAGEAFCRQTRR